MITKQLFNLFNSRNMNFLLEITYKLQKLIRNIHLHTNQPPNATFTAVKPAAVQKNTVKPAAIEIDVRVYYNDYGNHRNNTEETRF